MNRDDFPEYDAEKVHAYLQALKKEDALTGLPYCCREFDPSDPFSSGCSACPVHERCDPRDLYEGLVMNLEDLPQSDQRDHFIEVLDKCRDCDEEECWTDCPTYPEFGEEHENEFIQKVYAFLKDAGVYMK